MFLSHFNKRFTVNNVVLGVAIATLFCFFSISSLAQENTSRPKLGLVLSGGGAHGIAHLGVIKAMEEAGLRPDVITGTSMGSIIGGFYSLGYSADSLHKLLKSLNWNDMLSNKIPENRIIFPEKYRFYNSIISLPFKPGKVLIPSGLNNGQLIENSLSYFAWPAADIKSFSDLPIPFMCNATDIITYSKVNFRNGYLPDAIRGSFSVPSIFTALKVDTLLLLDGGLIRNFAASEAIEMGAGIIIGSYVGFEINSADELQTLPAIIEQIAMFRSLEDFNNEKKLANILIKPKVDRFSVTDFNNVDSLMQTGYDAALPYMDRFRKLADSLDKLGPQKSLPYILDKSDYTFDSIEITGNKFYSDNQILGVLDINPGEPVNRDELTGGIELLYGKAWFEKVKYKIIPRNDSLLLSIECEEKPRGMLYGSVHYDNSLQSGLILGITAKNLLTHSVIDINSFIGKYYRVRAGILQYIGSNQKLAVSMNFIADNTLFPWLQINDGTGNTYSRSNAGEIGINNYIGLNNVIALTGSYSQTNLKPDYISVSGIRNYRYDFLDSYLTFSRNNLNTRYFPDKGLVLNISGGISALQYASLQTDTSRIVVSDNSSFRAEHYFTIHAGIKQYIRSGSKITFSIGGDVLYISDSDSISSQNNFYLLGGIQPDTRRSIPMAGFHPNEIKTRRMAIIRAEMNFEFIRDLHLNLMADLAAMEDNFFPYEPVLLSGYGLGLGYNSIIGPVKAGVMYGAYSDEKHFSRLKAYLSVGYNF